MEKQLLKELVSILVPCYNHENYIDDCLKSLCAQTYQAIELIIIDDCSNDRSYERLINWEVQLRERFVNVYIQKNKINLGITKNLNTMLKLAKGQYIKLLASDDMLTPNAIEWLVLAAKNEKSDIYFSNIAFVPECAHYDSIQLNKLSLRYSENPKDGTGLTGQLCENNYIAAPGVFIPKKTFDKYGLFDEQYILEDFEFWLRISVYGSFKYINIVTALYRQNRNSLSKYEFSKENITKHRKFHEDILSIFKKYQKYANKSQKMTFFNRELESAIGINDRYSVHKLYQEMKENNIPVKKYNWLRMVLVNIKIYPLFRKLKHMLKSL